LSVIPDTEAKALLKALPHKKEHIEKSPIRIFVESFARSAGKGAGKQSIDLAFTVLTGGANHIPNAIDIVKDIVKKSLQR